MIDIGQTYHLPIVKQVSFGVYVDAQEYGTVLLPKRYVPEGADIGDEVEVFLYLDSEDQIIATTETPLAKVGECALLRVKEVNDTGAFLDWGLSKDLLVPYAEQHKPMQSGRDYVVFLYVDEASERIVASSKLGRHLEETTRFHKANQAVDLLICGKSDMGYKAVINNTHIGLIFRDDAFKPLKYGERTKGFIKGVREDGKIDVALQLPAGVGRQDLSERIMQHLQEQGGNSNLSDKSSPEEIYRMFQVSKKNYKKALGALYKQKRIVIEDNKISRIKK